MPSTIDDWYKHASITGKWLQALITTCAVEESGEVKYPTERFERDNLEFKLHAL